MQIDPQAIIQTLGNKIAEGIIREAMQQAYAEELEKQIASLQSELTEANNDLAKKRGQEAAREANGVPASK